jgi:hypothetical protein
MTSSLGGFSGNRGGGRSGGEIIPKGYEKGRLANLDPQQMKLFQSLFAGVGPDSYLSKLAGGDEGTFAEIEAPALRQHAQIQGGLASRFGGGGALRGSGYQNAASGEASNFALQLQQQRQSLHQQAIKDLFGMSQDLLGVRPYETDLFEKQQKQRTPSGVPGLIGAGVGAAGGFFAGGPGGALKGAQLGFNVGNGFSGGGF